MTIVCPCCETEVETKLDVDALVDGGVALAGTCPNGCGEWRFVGEAEFVPAEEPDRREERRP